MSHLKIWGLNYNFQVASGLPRAFSFLWIVSMLQALRFWEVKSQNSSCRLYLWNGCAFFIGSTRVGAIPALACRNLGWMADGAHAVKGAGASSKESLSGLNGSEIGTWKNLSGHQLASLKFRSLISVGECMKASYGVNWSTDLRFVCAPCGLPYWKSPKEFNRKKEPMLFWF